MTFTAQRRAEDKKRKGHHHYDSDRKKRAKPHPTTLTDLPPPPEHLLTDHDKNALDRWKRIQQTNNASGGGRGTGGGGAPSEETLKQLEQLQGQVGELKKMEGHVHSLQRQLSDQQRVNREQGDLIQRLMEQNRQLQQHNLLLAQRCQEAGLTSSPSSSLSDSMATTPGGERPGSGGRQSTVMVGGGFGGASLHSFPGTTPPYPTTNPVTPPNRQMGLQHMGGSMLRPSYSTHPGVQSRVVSHHDLGGTKGGMSYVMPPSMGDGYPPPSLSDHALSSPMSNGNGRGGNFAYPFGTCPMPPDGGVDCKMSGSRAFSPNPMTGVDPYLDSILNLTGLPTGSGAGYGVGVTDDELLPVSLQLNLRSVCVCVCVCVWCVHVWCFVECVVCMVCLCVY